MTRSARVRLPAAPDEWSRRRLQIALTVGAATALAVVAGGAWSVRTMLDDASAPDPAAHAGVHPASREEVLAVAPLPTADPEDALPGPLTTGSTEAITLPPPRSMGAVQVPTGFPHTPEGALAQLIAIDQRALESASVVTAQEVIASWAEPGGPTAQTWSGVRAVVVLLSAAGLSAEATDDLQVALRPAMGFIKGSVGEDFVVPCVDFVATITPTAATGASTPVRVAAADCQRMVWRGDRWRIGSGEEPATPPSVWPGTPASYDAGYRWLAAAP
jgi:hypothetical protein